MGLTRSWQFHKAHHSTILQSNCCVYLYSATKTITKTQAKLVCNSVLLCHHHQIMLQSSLILCLLPKTTTSGKNGHSAQLCNCWEKLHCLVYTQPRPGHAVKKGRYSFPGKGKTAGGVKHLPPKMYHPNRSGLAQPFFALTHLQFQGWEMSCL